jgi:hypothetical protein
MLPAAVGPALASALDSAQDAVVAYRGAYAWCGDGADAAKRLAVQPDAATAQVAFTAFAACEKRAASDERIRAAAVGEAAASIFAARETTGDVSATWYRRAIAAADTAGQPLISSPGFTYTWRRDTTVQGTDDLGRQIVVQNVPEAVRVRNDTTAPSPFLNIAFRLGALARAEFAKAK